jgi:hypothetical protein
MSGPGEYLPDPTEGVALQLTVVTRTSAQL